MLGFSDLIEVKAQANSQNIDVQLRNPEHDLTNAIKKVLQKYQSSGNLFDTVKSNIVFNAYISKDNKLPAALIKFKQTVLTIAQGYEKQSAQHFSIQVSDPDENSGQVAKQIAKDYGFQPMATSLLSTERFYFYLTLTDGKETIQIPFQDVGKSSLERNFKTAMQHFAKGFSKNVALVVPKNNPQLAQYGMAGAQYNQLQRFLGTDLNIKQEDLSDGSVSGDADILLLLAPKNLDDKQVFAVDQFLMQGGTVIAATSPFSASFANRSLAVQPQTSGLEPWLAHYGLSIEHKLVLDAQNASLPVPVTRNVGGLQLQEMRMLDYPYFIDVRGEGLAQHNAITADLPQLTMAWSSPIVVDQKQQKKRKITELIHSSANSWLSSSTDVMPKFDQQGESLFVPQGKQKAQLLAVISEGSFDSYFADKKSPLLNKNVDQKGKEKTTNDNISMTRVIKHSPKSARIILFSSNDFLRDQVIQMSGSANGSKYENNNQLIANTLDWALDDQGLMAIRSRGHFNRTLPPMDHNVQLFWEYLNYGLAALLLLIIAYIQRRQKRNKQQFYQHILSK